MNEDARLESLYAQAQQALKAKHYDRAADLLREILIADENYRDASLLLARTVRAKRRRWYSDPRLWGALGVAALVGLGMWLVQLLPAEVPPSSTPLPSVAAGSTAASTLTEAPPPTGTPAPAPAPTPIPLAWKRIYAGQEFSRDMVTAIVIDPIDPDVVYVGTESAGIYKSIDGGLSWTPIHSGLLRARIDSLFMDPNDPKVIYAGVRNGGVYRTTDGGQRWEAFIQGMTDLESDNPAIVGGSRTGNSQVYFSHGFSFYSLANQSWLKTSGSFTVTQFAVHPDDGSRLIVFDIQNLGGGDPPRLYRSEDSGKSMDSLGAPPGGTWKDRLFYATDAGGQEQLFVLRGHFIDGSTDGGRNWATSYGCYAATLDSDGFLVAACHGRLVRTTNGGRTWGSFSQLPLETSSVEAITISAFDPNMIFLGGDGGLYKSLDGGKTWQERHNGLGAGWLELAVHATAPSALYAQEGSCFLTPRLEYPLYRSTDGGNTWGFFPPASGCGLQISANGQTLYRDWGGWEEIGGRSADGGQTWPSWSPPRACSSHGITAHPSEPGVAFSAGPEALCMTQDAGRTWEVVGSTRSWGAQGARLYLSLEEGRVYSVLRYGMVQSHSGGRYWTGCGPDVAFNPLTEARLAVDPRDSDRLLLATLGEGVWVSENGCDTWQKNATGIRGQFVNAVVIDPRQPDVVYAGTDNGAFVSFDGGTSWTAINDGLLGALVVYSIGIDWQSNVYAATPYGIFGLEAR